MNKRTALALIAGSLGIAAAAWFFAPRVCCGERDESQEKFEEVLGRAMQGDLGAIEALNADYASSGHKEQARYWALVGAIYGSRKLTETYEALRRNAPDINTAGEDAIIQKNLSRPGAAGLARTFNITGAQGK